MKIEQLTPVAVWKNFHALTQVPRPSGHLEKIQAFLLQWGKDAGIETWQDEAGNILMRKPATAGLEGRKGLVLQAHMDMVPQKTADSPHDFLTDPIPAYIDGDWVKTHGTTLGADDGMGVAAIMAIMEDKTLKHGPLEALITADEETGMFGAFGLKPGELQGKVLLNLDSETEGELYIGCAGGVDVTATMQYLEIEPFENRKAYKVTLSGLRGGHSGLEICEGRANANKLMGRFMREAVLRFDAGLAEWKGGNMRNAIPRDAHVVITVPVRAKSKLLKLADECQTLWNAEFATIESGIALTVEPVAMPESEAPEEIRDNLINAILACQDGVMRYIPTIPDTVETSSNLSIVEIGEGEATFSLLVRSSNDSMKMYQAVSLKSCFDMAGMKVKFSGAYSGWQPNVDSPLLAAMKKVYRDLFGTDAEVKVIHAGLECGIIGAANEGMDMISFGPTLLSPHSPDERVFIPSIPKFYDLIHHVVEEGVK
ncbi:MAG: aminoacyl-histidine dipeptidase [Bacteroidaceae bacterium]|nr:aminoacyl-histidine dipeptidase [Bacteroidaceae bacterium]